MHLLALASHMPPALSQSALVVAFDTSPAKAGPVKLIANTNATVEIRVFISILLATAPNGVGAKRSEQVCGSFARAWNKFRPQPAIFCSPRILPQRPWSQKGGQDPVRKSRFQFVWPWLAMLAIIISPNAAVAAEKDRMESRIHA